MTFGPRLLIGVAGLTLVAASLAATDASADWTSRDSFARVACDLARANGAAYAVPGPGADFGYGPASCAPRVIVETRRPARVRYISVRG